MANLQEVLKILGGKDGFQIPVANAENHQLEQELASLILHKTKAKCSLDNSLGRLNNLQEHFDYVKHENEQIQKLINTYKQQYDSEEHQYHLVKAEKAKVEHDAHQTAKRIKYLEERKDFQKRDLQKAVIKVDTVKQETGWDIEALKAWEDALRKRDENNKMIEHNSKEDERRFNELEAKRQFLQADYDAKIKVISKMVCELHSSEMIIERTGKAIKQQINERESLITQWKEAVRMLQQRDLDIEAEQDRILEEKRVLDKQQEYLDEVNALLRNEQKSNENVEFEIEKLSTIHSRMKRDLDTLEQDLFVIISESYSLKREMTSAAQNLEKLRMKRKQLSEEIDYKDRLCVKDQEDMENLDRKIKEMKGSTLSSEERIKKIQKLIETEETYCKMFLADTEKINSYLYRTDQLLKDQQQVGKNLEVQINNGYCICNKLRKHIRDEEKSLEKLKEVVYDMQFRIDEFEQKLCKLEGSNKQEEHADEKEDRIKELEKISADHAEVQHTLQSQVDRLQDEMRKLSNFIASDTENLKTLQNSVENNLLIYDIGEKQIAAAKKAAQEKQVEENLIRLRINHIEGDVEKEKQKIFNLQKLRLTLDQVMKERKLEIESKKSIVLSKKRDLFDEKGRLKCDLANRRVKLEQLQKKYHIELMSLGKDDDGQPLSVTHFKIKNAQEKFLMQKQGDELDQKIKIAEREIEAIENTLKMVNVTNVVFRNNLAPLKDEDKEIPEMKDLKTFLSQTVMELRELKQEQEELQTSIKELSDKMEKVVHDKTEIKDTVNELEEENLFVEKQEKNKEDKIKRTVHQLRKVLTKLGGRNVSVYEQDLEIQQLTEANSSVSKKLHSMSTNYIETTPQINKYCDEQHIILKHSTSTNSSSSFSATFSSSSDNNSSRSVTFTMDPISVKKVDILFK